MKGRVVAETVRSPAFVHMRWTSKVFQDGLRKVPRSIVAANPKILIERCKKRTSAALLATVILSLAIRLARPLVQIQPLGGSVRETVCINLVFVDHDPRP